MCKLLDGNLCLGQFEEGRRALLIGHEGLGGDLDGTWNTKWFYHKVSPHPGSVSHRSLSKYHFFLWKIVETKFKVWAFELSRYSKVDLCIPEI